MKNKLKILCILMILCLCGCTNENNKEVVNNEDNVPNYSSNDTVEDKQDENSKNNKLDQDTNTTNEENKEDLLSNNEIENNLNKNNTTNNNEVNTNNNNNTNNDNNQVTNNNTIENEKNEEDLPSKNETENNLENESNNDNIKLVYLDIYYYDSCSYCHQLFSFLDNLDENLKSKLVITKYNINEYNSEFNDAVNKFSENGVAGTPYTVFNNQKAVMGYSEHKILKYINEFVN